MFSFFAGATTPRAFVTFFLVIAAAAAAEHVPEDWLASADDEAVSFVQGRTSLKSGPRQVLGEAAAAPFDAAVFAQTDLEVSSARAPARAEEVTGTPAAEPAWLAAGEGESARSDEDMTCSLQGLTPGVCAMAALARPAVGAEGQSDLDFVDPDRLERALFQEIEAALAGTHGGISADRLAEVEEELGGFFSALPKNEAGLLDHATVRYAVHQRFVRKHAWYIRSLNPVGEAQTPASPGEALRGQVPDHLQRLIEKRQSGGRGERQGGRGLGARELAALAATLEHLIRGDLVERLKAAYGVHGLLPNGTASRANAAEVLKTYMAHFLSLRHRSGYAVTLEEARKERRSVEAGYGGWRSLVVAVDKAVGGRLPEDPQAPLAFSEVLSAAAEVMDKYELASAQECKDMKRDLTAMPNGASGRVLLADLHRKALEGSMLFSESTEYLATLGALEGEQGSVSVLVPNYIYSPSNCLGTTSFFDLCCPNECEVILDQLESRLRTPDATPAEVEGFVNSVRAEGPLSEDALEELDILAHERGSRMPLHGYSFAAWLHRAFPGECSKPRREDFAGARQEAEVPAAQAEFQAVARLSFIAASKSDLIAELEQEPGRQPEVAEPQVNASKAGAGTAGDLGAEQLKALAASKLGAGGLKISSAFDVASLAQVRADVSDEAALPAEERQTLGLNVRRRP